jgi:hypothetical protein
MEEWRIECFFCFLLQNWIMTTLKFFLGPQPLPKNLAIFFLAIFGFACEDLLDHYEESTTLSYYQYSILADLHNHTDWDCLTDLIPIDFGDGKKMFLTLAQAICCCLTHDPVWKDNVLSDMLDEMFQIPGEWLRDNVASFLLFCNESVSLDYTRFFLLNSIIYLMSLDLGSSTIWMSRISNICFDFSAALACRKTTTHSESMSYR